MTIIDKEGRLFSKINLLDAMIILVLVLVLSWVGVRVVNRYAQVKEYDQYLIQVRAPNLDETIAKSIHKGDIISTPTGAYFAQIITEPEISPTQVFVTTPEGKLIPRTQPKLKDVVFTMQARVPKGSFTIRYGNQTLKVGATGFIETARQKYTILVLSIDPLIEEVAEEESPLEQEMEAESQD